MNSDSSQQNAELSSRQPPGTRAKAILTDAKTEYLTLCSRPLFTQEKAWPFLIGQVQMSMQPFLTMATLFWPVLAEKTHVYLKALYNSAVEVDSQKSCEVVKAFNDPVVQSRMDTISPKDKRVLMHALGLLAGLTAKIEHMAEWLDICIEFIDAEAPNASEGETLSRHINRQPVPIAATAGAPKPAELLRELYDKLSTDDDREMFRRVALETDNPNPRKGYKKDMLHGLAFDSEKEINACLGRVRRSQSPDCEAPNRRTGVEAWEKNNPDLTEKIQTLADEIRKA